MPPNKRMQLTKLRAAPERQDKVPPCAPAGGTDGGTASQLIRRVLRTRAEWRRVVMRSAPSGFAVRVIGIVMLWATTPAVGLAQSPQPSAVDISSAVVAELRAFESAHEKAIDAKDVEAVL